MSIDYATNEIELILDDIKEYKKIKRDSTKRLGAILKIINILKETNYPEGIILFKLLDILKDYDIPTHKIREALEYYENDPSKANRFYKKFCENYFI
jgi:hypothetical protein